MAELLSPAAGVVAAEADESVAAVLVPAALSVVVALVSELELHELRVSKQAAKRGKEARSMGLKGKRN